MAATSAPTFRTFTISMPETEAAVTGGTAVPSNPPSTTKLRVSIPRPPEIESARLKVEAAVGVPSPPVTAKVIDPLNVSFPAVLVVPASPLRLAPSIPVVSVLIWSQNDVNTHFY